MKMGGGDSSSVVDREQLEATSNQLLTTPLHTHVWVRLSLLYHLTTFRNRTTFVSRQAHVVHFVHMDHPPTPLL